MIYGAIYAIGFIILAVSWGFQAASKLSGTHLITIISGVITAIVFALFWPIYLVIKFFAVIRLL